MGHGWKYTGKSEVSRDKCECGSGYIITYELEEESDFPPFDRTSRETENNCPICNAKKA